MLKNVLVFSFLGGLSSPLYAKTTISGAIDIYLDWTKTANETALRLDSNTYGNSHVRFKADENLGGDLKVTAQYQIGFAADSGKMTNNNPTYIALEGPFGKISAGQQYTPHAEVLYNADAFASGFWGTPYAIFEGGINYFLVPKTIMYDSMKLLGTSLRISTMHSFGNRDGNGPGAKKGQTYFAVHYTPIPALYIGVAAVRDSRFSAAAQGANSKIIGIRYDHGSLRFSGGVQRIDQADLGRRVHEYTIGTRIEVAPRNLLLFNYAITREQKPVDRQSWTYGATWIHSPSALTEIYFSVAKLGNNQHADANFGIAVPKGGASTDVMLGLKKSF